MKPLGDVKKHFWLSLGMAKRTGVDMHAAIKEGRLGETEYAEHVTQCRACPSVDQCERWLEGRGETLSPPQFCVNRDRLIRLSDRL